MPGLVLNDLFDFAVDLFKRVSLYNGWRGENKQDLEHPAAPSPPPAKGRASAGGSYRVSPAAKGLAGAGVANE